MRIRSTALLLTALLVAGTAQTNAQSNDQGNDLGNDPTQSPRSLFIVQSKSANAAAQRLRSAGVATERELDVINAVAAYLTPEQKASLDADSSVRVFEDRQLAPRGLFSSLGGVLGSTSLIKLTQQVTTPIVSPLLRNAVTSSLTSPLIKGLSAGQKLQDGKSFGLLGNLLYETNYPALIGADSLQAAGITGKGVTIAVLDTGFWQDMSQNYGNRVLASIDVTNGGTARSKSDPYGHGTHITSIAASGAQNLDGGYSRHRAEREPGRRACVQRRRRRPLHRRDRGRELDRRQSRQVQDSRAEPFFRRAAAVVLLGRSAQPGRDGRMARGHRRRGVGGQRRSEPDDDRRAGQRSLRDHGRRADRQQHAVRRD